ncbi:ABC transporter ATP-binding protein [Actinoplanes solisilvae]|uniref:ABC transporter ATP-binding protein n=1 Tax=Actinoplanes solisilvae TaxID=2486853 RepID=UPI000FDB41A2|nr:ABC transporter ATP-binding protein [Actinoplanes solisilvae]
MTTAELLRSTAVAVRLAWQADRRTTIEVLLAQVLSAAGIAVLLLLAQHVLGQVIRGGGRLDSSAAGTFLLGTGVVIAAGTAGSMLRAYGSARQRVLMTKLDHHVVALVLRAAATSELIEFEKPEFHDRVQRAVFAARGQPAMVVTTLVVLIQAVLTALTVSAVFVVMTWWLLPLAILAAAPVLRAGARERDAGYGLHHGLAENKRVRQYLERLLTGRDEAKEVRALGLGPALRQRWDLEYRREVDGTIETYRRHLRHKLLAHLVSGLFVLAVVTTVGWLMAHGFVDLPTAAAALTGFWLLSARLQMIGALTANMGSAVAYLSDLRAFLAEETPASTVRSPRAGFESIRAESVSFRYPGSTQNALSDVDIEVGRGEVVALVGPNGSGKSTLAKLLSGLYRPDEGVLTVDGVPADDLESLRAMSAVVFQDYVRFRLTAGENITFGRADDLADPSSVEAAARQAGAHDFVTGLPHDYATVLSKEFTGGADLSGGQWQRLALARAFYRSAPFVILDEPTASLDPEAEADLFGRIRELFAGRTVVLISHRFSSVRDADRIYVLDRGRVLEEGTHHSLMALDGTYARLYRLQAQAYVGS